MKSVIIFFFFFVMKIISQRGDLCTITDIVLFFWKPS